MTDNGQPSWTFNWELWFGWVLATTLAWLAGWAFLGEFWVGLTLGFGQWLVLRQRIAGAGWWVGASTLGWAIGHVVVLFLLPPSSRQWAGLIIGPMVGLAQWLVLRSQLRRSLWYVVMSGLGWWLALSGFLGVGLVGTVGGALTGAALAMLLD